MERLYSSKDIAANKLIILYLLKKLKSPVISTQLTSIILDYHYMDFFSFHQHINELLAEGHVTSSSPEGVPGTTKQCLYGISSKGEALLEELTGLIPPVEKNRIDRTASSLRAHVREEIAVTADYTPIDRHRNTVCLKISEGDTDIIKIEMLTGSGKDARMLCKKWKSNTQELYSRIVDILVGIDHHDSGSGDADCNSSGAGETDRT